MSEIIVRELGLAIEATLNFNEIPYPFEYFAKQGLLIPQHLEKAVEKRRLEFLAGRLCALKACKALGLDVPAKQMLLSHQDRSPIWPKCVSGSISHSSGLAAAMVAKSQDKTLIGLDIEAMISNPNPGMIRQICHNNEWQDRPKDLSDSLALTLIFSLKESLYKALYPKVKKFFGFEYAKVDLTPYPDFLKITLVKELPLFPEGSSFRAAFTVHENVCKTWLHIAE